MRPELQPPFELIGAQMNITNPKRHHRLRALVAKAFTPRDVDALRRLLKRWLPSFWIG
ncbi:cytochrome P450 [Synechococcus sp. CS-1332]|uniref:cytochrome P450 n=1 Tax=Synechococcus sp. CS-1332 TaxID=2847972 RepID=UPI00223AB79C|nr:cytochrome P450 [Synechococcus sp. CS-1332]MCT0207574.1 cytochrome P450 [Synechococcus sp. CS-1332]